MYSTYLAPTERPVDSLAIKRALLMFDRVWIPDPDDRDFFPPMAVWNAMSGGVMPVAINDGNPVRLLGKAPGFDGDFDRVMEEVSIARREGIVDVITSFDRTEQEGSVLIGAIPTGGYPLNTEFLLWAYRNLARDNEALVTAVADDKALWALGDDIIKELGSTKCTADCKINDSDAPPIIVGPLSREDLRGAVTEIARGRLASVMKSVGFCAAKQMVPTFNAPNFAGTAAYIAGRAAKVIDGVAEFDTDWALRNRVLRIAHQEYVDDEVLAKLTVDDVLKLRTKAWGEHSERRDAMLQSVAELARETKSSLDFDVQVVAKISDYRKSFDDIVNERKALNFGVRCEFAKVALGAIGAISSGAAISAMSQVQNAVGAGALLLAGCLYVIDQIKDFKPIRDNLISAEQEFQDNACLGINNFYKAFSP